MTETPDVVEESPYLRCHSLVTIEVDPDPDPDPQVQVVYLSAAGNAGMKWLRDTGKGRQLIKHISSSRLPQWALEAGPPSKHQELYKTHTAELILHSRAKELGYLCTNF